MRPSPPHISVSLAPPEEILEEPYSPLTPNAWPTTPASDDDGLRSHYLSPPPSASSPQSPRQLSPLRPPESPVRGAGLERERFDALLKASQERIASVGAKKSADLRKGIAMKAHKEKQSTWLSDMLASNLADLPSLVERRALFLAKLRAPPSPSAIGLPKTPPDSPAIFHYTLPSPGLASPLAMFDAFSFSYNSVEPWVEQVDFRLPEDMQSKSLDPKAIRAMRTGHTQSPKGKPLPSLEQISARLSTNGHDLPTPPPTRSGSPPRLPAFLQTHAAEPPRASIPTDVTTTPTKVNRLPIGVGRIRAPLKAAPAMLNLPPMPGQSPPSLKVNRIVPPPQSPRSPIMPKLQITTTIVPRSATLSPTELSEQNVLDLSRTRTAKDMLSTLKRRTQSQPSDIGFNGRDFLEEQKEKRRRSSPAELPALSRSGFRHPVLDLPGGF